jgi:hypothetical protein
MHIVTTSTIIQQIDYLVKSVHKYQKEIFMWLSITTFDVVAINANLSLFNLSVINDKKQELQAVDGAGDSVEGWASRDPSTIPPDTETVVIKRAWNTQSAAQEFVDFVTAKAGNLVVATVEEQV